MFFFLLLVSFIRLLKVFAVPTSFYFLKYIFSCSSWSRVAKWEELNTKKNLKNKKKRRRASRHCWELFNFLFTCSSLYDCGMCLTVYLVGPLSIMQVFFFFWTPFSGHINPVSDSVFSSSFWNLILVQCETLLTDWSSFSFMVIALSKNANISSRSGSFSFILRVTCWLTDSIGQRDAFV